MIVSAHQPYFCPYPGYFAKAMNSDVFVVMDSVQFPRGGTWITRNRFKNDRGAFWLGIPVWRKGRGLQKINEVRICHEGSWKRKHLESLRSSYAHAPYLDEHLPVFERLFTGTYDLVSSLDAGIISYVTGYLDIPVQTLYLSDLDICEKGTGLLVAVCKTLGASEFLAWAAARKYLDEGLFLESGIEVSYMNPPSLVYPQLWGDFIPDLSIFDLLLNCGKKAREIMEKHYMIRSKTSF